MKRAELYARGWYCMGSISKNTALRAGLWFYLAFALTRSLDGDRSALLWSVGGAAPDNQSTQRGHATMLAFSDGTRSALNAEKLPP